MTDILRNRILHAVGLAVCVFALVSNFREFNADSWVKVFLADAVFFTIGCLNTYGIWRPLKFFKSAQDRNEACK